MELRGAAEANISKRGKKTGAKEMKIERR